MRSWVSRGLGFPMLALALLVLPAAGRSAAGQSPGAAVAGTAPGPASGAQVAIDLSQARVALAILGQHRAGAVEGRAWEDLWRTPGFIRLEQRQRSFGAKDVAGKMRAFLASEPALASLESLEAAVARWHGLQVDGAARRALAYLPAGTRLRATIYPVIKSATNSFVYDLDGDPAIFMHVNGKRSAVELDNILAHELHHVGSVQGCREPAGREALAAGSRDALDWMSGFGEGMATLAAAGDPDTHPHAASGAGAWVVWERDVARFNEDVRRLEAFFLELIDGELDADAQRRAGFAFINTDEVPQGAFYTVGWKMAAIVERALGRDRVIAAVCDPRLLLESYNEVVAADPENPVSLPAWSAELLAAMRLPEDAP